MDIQQGVNTWKSRRYGEFYASEAENRKIIAIPCCLPVERRLNHRFDHRKFCLQPKFSPVQAHPTASDELPNRIIAGGVTIKANVAEFTENGAIFVDGTKVDDIEAVVLATGYIFGFPFLDKCVTEVKENKINLFKNMFPPDLEKSTLAIIGCFQPVGAVMPVSEMQCRLATRVFKGLARLPNKSEMWQNITEKQTTMAFRYNKSQRHTIQVDYITFMDELAELIGCNLDFKKLFMSDPRLAIQCYFGACTPYQFRLMGPGSWKGARQAIMTQWDRIYQPLRTRPCEAQKEQGIGMMILLSVVVVALLVYLVL